MNQRAGFLLPENNRDNFISSLKKFLLNQQKWNRPHNFRKNSLTFNTLLKFCFDSKKCVLVLYTECCRYN